MARSPTLILALLLPAALAAAAARAHAQAGAPGHSSIRGTVTDTAGHPLPGALVLRRGSADTVRADSLGRYAVEGLGVGIHGFLVRHRGYAPIEMEITFTKDTSLTVDVPLEPSAGNPVMLGKLASVGFAERREHAVAEDRTAFIGPDQIAERDPVRISQLLEGVRDISVRVENGISVVYGQGGQCVMRLWVDGQQVQNAFPPVGSRQQSRRTSAPVRYTGLDDFLPVDQVAAIEVYPRPALVPAQFRGGAQEVAQSQRGRDFETRSAECGALILWTR